MIKAIIFDCFGVIYPSAPREYFEHHKSDFKYDSSALDKLDLQNDLGEITRADFFSELEKITGIEAAKIRVEFERIFRADEKLVELIKKLKLTYKIGLLSNAGKEEVGLINRDKIDELFDSMTISFELKIAKPDPKIYLVATDRLGVKPEECIFVDDRMANLDAAGKLGMQTIHYPEFGKIPKEFLDL